MYELSSPADDSVARVRDWLVTGNAKGVKIRNNGGFISAVISVDGAVALFSRDNEHPLKFHRFQHQIKEDRTVIRAVTPLYIPEEIIHDVQVFDGINNFPCECEQNNFLKV